jgi:hypothetical protein
VESIELLPYLLPFGLTGLALILSGVVRLVWPERLLKWQDETLRLNAPFLHSLEKWYSGAEPVTPWKVLYQRMFSALFVLAGIVIVILGFLAQRTGGDIRFGR